MYVNTSKQKPVAYVGTVREEDVDDVMHQFCEPAYGAKTEDLSSPFLWGFNLAEVMTRATLKGFEVMLVQ